MRRSGLTLALLAALALLWAPTSSLAADRAFHEARRPPVPVQFRIARPINWRPDQSFTDQGASLGFVQDDLKRGISRGLYLQAVSNGPASQPVEDVFLLSEAERYSIASVLLDEYTKNQSFLTSSIKQVRIIKINDLNGIRVNYEAIANPIGSVSMDLGEFVYIPYTQNINKQMGSAAITIQCRYTGHPDNARRLASIFRGEGRRTCQRFYDSLTILDRWR
jgi:hypothetical protein